MFPVTERLGGAGHETNHPLVTETLPHDVICERTTYHFLLMCQATAAEG